MYLSRLSRAFVSAVFLSAASAIVNAQGQTPARIEVTLTGGQGRAAPPLTKEDVRVYVDGVERPVVSFEKGERPVSYGLVVDNSGSLRSQIGRVVGAAKYLIDEGGPDDKAFVMRFIASDNVELRQRLTADKAALHKALDSMYVEGGFTALLDALHDAGKYLTKEARRDAAGGRRLALVLITDGEDRGSISEAQEVLKLLKDGGVRVYCLGLTAELENNQLFTKLSKEGKARNLLSKIADETGGRAFYVKTVEELEAAARDIAQSLNARYFVGYEPPEPNATGPGKVEVKLVGAAGKENLKAAVVAPAVEKQ